VIDPAEEARRDAVTAYRLAAVLWLGLLLVEVGAWRRSAPISVEPRGEPTEFTPLLFGPGLDPTTASEVAWEALPAIGPKRAHAIVEARRLRMFCAPEHLRRVPGLGPKTLAGLRPWLAPRPWSRPCPHAGDDRGKPSILPEMRGDFRLIEQP